MMQAVRLVAVLAILALAGALGWRVWQSRTTPPQPLPQLTLLALDGRADFDPAQIEGAYLLNLWGSWCAPCQIEHPVLMALQAEGVAIYGIAWRDSTEAANDFLDAYGDPYAGVMLDVDGLSARALEISGAPETLVVSSDGHVLVRWPGPITADVLRNRIYPALEREAGRGWALRPQPMTGASPTP